MEGRKELIDKIDRRRKEAETDRQTDKGVSPINK